MKSRSRHLIPFLFLSAAPALSAQEGQPNSAASPMSMWSMSGSRDDCRMAGGFELIEEWRYLPPETSAPDRLIASAASAARHPGTGIYVVDQLGHSVLQLSLGGDFIRRIGRVGQGPGEFRFPIKVRATDDGFAVLDRSAGISFFDTDGIFQRTARLQPFPAVARDFLIGENGDLVVAGTVSSSEHAIHVYGRDGQYLEGLGQLRMDLEELVLRMRYSDGYVAESGSGRLAYARRVPFEFMLFERSELLVRVAHSDVIHDYVHEVATPLEPDGWKFSWRHPGLGSFIPLPGGCFLAAVGRLPDTLDGRLPEAEDFYSELVVLSDQGRVLRRQTLSYYFRPTQAWRDSSGRNHILGIGRDKATGLNFPIQYLAVRAAPAGTAPHRDPTFARTSPQSHPPVTGGVAPLHPVHASWRPPAPPLRAAPGAARLPNPAEWPECAPSRAPSPP